MADGKDIAQGIPNEDLWRLIRRFDKQVSHVHAIPRTHVQQLDLGRAAEEQFPPAKLQKTIERFYVSVIVKLGLLFDHVNRLRSWDDPRRTGTFGAVYLVAWLCDRLIPILTSVLVVMIFCPSIRARLFPPNEETLTAGTTKHDKPTQGAAKVQEGEEAEADATNFVNGLTTSIVQGSNEPIQAETSETGNIATPADDSGETGEPKPTPPAISVTMRALSDITDLSERVSNLFAPSPPFGLVAPRLRIAMILTSVCLLFFLLSSHTIVKAGALVTGLAFFGDPVLSRGVDFLNRKAPNWKEYLDIEKTLLKGVPTNAQLTLTLLRIGEINSTPLPVPPPPGLYKDQYPSQWQLFRRKTKAIDAAQKEDDDNQNQDGDDNQSQTRDPTSPNDGLSTRIKAKPKKWLRVLKFARRAITTAIKGHIAFNRAMALSGAGSKHYAKGLVAAVLERNIRLIAPPSLSNGPFTFEAKFERKRGTAVIDSFTEGNPILYFTSKQATKLNMDDLRVDSQKADAIGFQVPVAEIKEMQKTEGLGWKGKLIVQFAAGSEDATNEGLVVKGSDPEQSFHLTDMRGRNQLFNRLVAGGAQCWELY